MYNAADLSLIHKKEEQDENLPSLEHKILSDYAQQSIFMPRCLYADIIRSVINEGSRIISLR